MLDKNAIEAVSAGVIDVVPSQSAAMFLQNWSKTDRTSGKSGLLAALPRGAEIGAALANAGISEYRLTFKGATVLATTLSDIE